MRGFEQVEDLQPTLDEGAGTRGDDCPGGGEAVERVEEGARTGDGDGGVAVFDGQLAFEVADVWGGVGLVSEVFFRFWENGFQRGGGERGGIPTGPRSVRRVDLLENIDSAAAMGCGEDGCGVDVVLFAYAVTCFVVRPMFWNLKGKKLELFTATHLSQCLTIALVESMSVPSMSERIPKKVCVEGAAEKRSVKDWRDGVVKPEMAMGRVFEFAILSSKDLMGHQVLRAGSEISSCALSRM